MSSRLYRQGGDAGGYFISPGGQLLVDDKAKCLEIARHAFAATAQSGRRLTKAPFPRIKRK
jgi:hypothetical protein